MPATQVAHQSSPLRYRCETTPGSSPAIHTPESRVDVVQEPRKKGVKDEEAEREDRADTATGTAGETFHRDEKGCRQGHTGVAEHTTGGGGRKKEHGGKGEVGAGGPRGMSVKSHGGAARRAADRAGLGCSEVGGHTGHGKVDAPVETGSGGRERMDRQ